MWASKLLRAIQDWFTPPKKNEHVDEKYAQLQHIDPQELAKKFSLREDGRRLGESGVPPTDSHTLSGPEALAISEVDKARQAYQGWAVRRLATLDEAIASFDIRHKINSALQSEQVFINKVANHLTAEDHELRQARNELQKASKAITEFKKNNNIFRDAHCPSKSQKILGYSILALMVLVEGIINGQIFQKGLAGGTIEGITYAGLFALINVWCSYILGSKGFSRKNHVDWHQKIIGFISLGLTLLISSLIGLMLGHFRLALSNQVDQAEEIALQRFLENPLGIGGMDSLLLFGVSLLFGIIAFVDGYNMDDKYPGYGAEQRLYDEALENYNSEVATIQEQLNDFKVEAIEELQTSVLTAQATLASLKAEIINKTAAFHRITVALDVSQAAANAAVQIFRTENQQGRLNKGHAGYPAYFDTAPELTGIEIPSFDITHDNEIAKELNILITRLIDDAQNIRRRIEEAFNVQYNQLIPLVGQFDGEINGNLP